MKTLNLDDFATDKRVITFKGVEHEVREMSVEDFIAASGDGLMFLHEVLTRNFC